MSPTAVLRRMTPADLDAVVTNERAAYPFPWSRGVFVDCVTAGYECWVASLGSEVIGHGVLSVGAGEAQLLNVCVAPIAQGAGYGRALATHLIGRAGAAGAERLFLEVRISNRVAMTLYDGLGFREIGRRRSYYAAENGREDAVVMALSLAGENSISAAGVLNKSG